VPACDCQGVVPDVAVTAECAPVGIRRLEVVGDADGSEHTVFVVAIYRDARSTAPEHVDDISHSDACSMSLGSRSIGKAGILGWT
jgi:hypothetical protein